MSINSRLPTIIPTLTPDNPNSFENVYISILLCSAHSCFAPRQDKCTSCSKSLLEENEEFVYYDFIDNVFLCEECKKTIDKKRIIRISKATFNAIFYVIRVEIKKIFSFELKSYTDFELFGQVFTDAMISGL